LKARFLLFRGERVIIDSDLAKLYGVTTARLKQQVRRNADRFPIDFMFDLTKNEYDSLMLQFATSKPTRGGRRKLPLVFTEHGNQALNKAVRRNRERFEEHFMFQLTPEESKELNRSQIVTRLQRRRRRAVCSRSDLYQFHAIFRYWLAAFSQHFFVQRNCFAYVGEDFVTGLSLADATGKTRHFGNNKTVFAGIYENSSCHV